MKRLTFILVVLTLALQFSFAQNSVKAADCSQYEGVSRIFWDGVELKSGQIGRLTILKDTPLYKLDGEKQVFSRTLKKGEFYRIYAFKPGKLSVGGGYYIDRDERIKYETPSKAKLDAVKCINQNTGLIDITKNNVLPVDASKSIISFYKMNNVSGFLVFDPSAGNHRFVPLTVKGMINDHFASKDSIFVLYFNNDMKSMNSWDLYRIDINSPYKTTKVLANVGYATTDGKYLYSIEFNNIVQNGQQVKGTQIYKTDLHGNSKQLVKEFTDFPLFYGKSLIVKNDFLYLRALNATTQMTEIHKIPLQDSGTEVLFEYNSRDLYFNYGQEFYLSYAPGSGKKDFYDPGTDQLYSFNGPVPHYDHMIEVYKGKLYYIDESFKLYQVDLKGNIKNIPVTVNGTIIGIEKNYLYYLDKTIIKMMRFTE
jgi:hypothetical protein